MMPGEELARILVALVLTVFLFWFGAYLETCRKRMIEKVRRKRDCVDDID
jgi:hypothetical protein